MNDTAEDLLVHRALERTASRADWDALRARAAADPDVWRRLAAALEDDGLVARAAAPAVIAADGVDLPELGSPRASEPSRRPALPAWSGWAAAALVLVTWIASAPDRGDAPSHRDGASAAPSAAASSPAPPDDRTEIVSELPARMLDSRPSEDGDGFDVLVLRRTVERRHVDALYRLAEDEHGRPSSVPEPFSPTRPTEPM